MIITVESPSGNRKWRLEPFDNGICWRLLKTPVNPDAKQEWINCECYHATLEAALKTMLQRMLCDPDDPTTFEFAPEDIERQAMRVMKAWLKDAGVEVSKHV